MSRYLGYCREILVPIHDTLGAQIPTWTYPYPAALKAEKLFIQIFVLYIELSKYNLHKNNLLLDETPVGV